MLTPRYSSFSFTGIDIVASHTAPLCAGWESLTLRRTALRRALTMAVKKCHGEFRFAFYPPTRGQILERIKYAKVLHLSGQTHPSALLDESVRADYQHEFGSRGVVKDASVFPSFAMERRRSGHLKLGGEGILIESSDESGEDTFGGEPLILDASELREYFPTKDSSRLCLGVVSGNQPDAAGRVLCKLGVRSVLVVRESSVVTVAVHRFLELFYSGIMKGKSVGDAYDHSLESVNKTYLHGEKGISTMRETIFLLPRESPDHKDNIVFPDEERPAKPGTLTDVSPGIPTNIEILSGVESYCIGRSETLQDLHRILESSCRCVQLHGAPGAGKARLASTYVAWAADRRYYAAGAIAIDVSKGVRPGLTSTLFHEFLKSVDKDENFFVDDGRKLQINNDHRLVELTQLVTERCGGDRKLLIAILHADRLVEGSGDSSELAECTARLLGASNGVRIIVSTKTSAVLGSGGDSIEWEPVEVKPLDPRSGVRLLLAQAPECNEEHAAYLAKQFGNLPMGLVICGKALNPKNIDCGTTDSRTLVEHVKGLGVSGAGIVGDELQKAFAASLISLGWRLKKQLYSLSLFHRTFTYEGAKRALRVLGKTEHQANSDLSVLLGSSMVEVIPATEQALTRYRLPRLLRAYARSQVTFDQSYTDQVLSVADYVLGVMRQCEEKWWSGDRRDAILFFETERDMFESLLMLCESSMRGLHAFCEKVVQIACACPRVARARMASRDRLSYVQKCIRMVDTSEFQRLTKRESLVKLEWRLQLEQSWCLNQMDNLSSSISACRKALKILNDAASTESVVEEEQDWFQLCLCIWKGECLTHWGYLMGVQRRNARTSPVLPEDDPQEQLKEADKELDRAEEVLEKLSRSSQNMLQRLGLSSENMLTRIRVLRCSMLCNLANHSRFHGAESAQRRNDQAFELHQRCLEIRMEIHPKPIGDIIQSLNNLGEIKRNMKKVRESQEFFRQAEKVQNIFVCRILVL